MICTKKHTKYQPADDEWKCPKCGSEDVFIEDEDEFNVIDCDLLHVSATVLCESCWYAESATKFVNRLIKQKNLCVCPTCKGSGYVSK